MNYNDLGIDVKYILTNKNDKNIGVVVNTVGFQTIKPNTQYPAPKHPSGYYFSTQKGRILDEFQLIYITKGEGQLYIDHKQITLRKGNIFLLCPNQWHSYMPTNETGWNEYYIGFESKIVFSWLENSFLDSENQVYDIGFNEELVKLYNRAIELAKFEKDALNFHLSGLVYQMLGLLIYEINNKQANDKCDVQLIQRAKIIMNEHVFQNLQTEDVAVLLHVNYTSFRKKFKNITGFAPAHYFRVLKMNKAKQLLTETCLSVKEISFRLNYCSPEAFIITFKQFTGYTPNEFRKCSV